MQTQASHFNNKLSAIFDYDPSLRLQVETHNVENRAGVSIRDVSYASLSTGRVKAYYALPAGPGPFAGVIFVHPGPGNRENFLEEAIELAGQGIASLLVEAPWAQGEAWGMTMGQPDHDRQEFTQIALDLRRAVDFMISQPEVDARRIGYVGHSFGALFGGILAGVEHRIHAFILMAGVGSFTEVMALNMPFLEDQALAEYRQGLNPIDPIHYIGQAAPAAFFFQLGEQDNFFGHDKFLAYYEAASEPKSLKWYEADHYLNVKEARQDRLEWLSKQLVFAKKGGRS